MADKIINLGDIGLQQALDVKATKLTENTTVNIPYGSTSAEIQALIDAQPKILNGKNLTFQFADCPHKLFNGSTDNVSANGTTATVTLASHGFTNGQEVSLNVMKQIYFNGTTYGISGNGTTATVTFTSHGFRANETIVIAGTTNFNGTYTIQTVATNSFTILSAYSGSETPDVNALIKYVNIDGDYIITYVDANTFTFSSSIVCYILPQTNYGIARLPWYLTTGLTFAYFQQGALFVNGNTSQVGGGLGMKIQKVYLKFTSSVSINVAVCDNVTVRDFKISSPFNCITYQINLVSRCTNCFLLADATKYCSAPQFTRCTYTNTVFGSNSASNIGNGILADYMSTVDIVSAYIHDGKADNGVSNSASFVFIRPAAKITGSVSQHVETNNGQTYVT